GRGTVKDIDSDNSAKVNKGSKDGPSRQTARRRPVMYVEPSRIHILPRLAGLDQRRTDALRDERPRSRHSTARTAPAAGSAARVSSIENETPKKGHRRQAPETALR